MGCREKQAPNFHAKACTKSIPLQKQSACLDDYQHLRGVFKCIKQQNEVTEATHSLIVSQLPQPSRHQII